MSNREWEYGESVIPNSWIVDNDWDDKMFTTKSELDAEWLANLLNKLETITDD